MHSKDWSSSLASSAFRASVAFSVIAAGIMTVATGKLISSFGTDSAVQIRIADFGWLSEIRPRLAKLSDEEIPAPNNKAIEVSNALRLRSAMLNGRSARAKAAQVRRLTWVKHTNVVIDTKKDAHVAIVVPAAPIVLAAESKVSGDALALQRMRWILRSRFVAALDTQYHGVNIQLAKADAVSEERLPEPPKKTAMAVVAAPVHQRKISPKKIEEVKPVVAVVKEIKLPPARPIVAAAVSVAKVEEKKVGPAKLVEERRFVPPSTPVVLITPEKTYEAPRVIEDKISIFAAAEVRRPEGLATARNQEESAEPVSPEAVDSHSKDSLTSQVSIQPALPLLPEVSMKTPGPIVNVNPVTVARASEKKQEELKLIVANQPIGYPKRPIVLLPKPRPSIAPNFRVANVPSNPPKQKAPEPKFPSVLPTKQLAALSVDIPELAPLKEELRDSITVASAAEEPAPSISMLSDVTNEPAAPKPCANRLIEAFEWHSEITTAVATPLTYEGAASGKQDSWSWLSANGYWPTLYLNAASGCNETPMVSNNSALLLAKLASGAPLERKAGIVFGKLLPGWSIQFSGRAEATVFLDENNQPSINTKEIRYFTLVNAAPGAQLLYVANEERGIRGAIAVPVVEGAATYIDLSSSNKVRIEGRVLDGGATEITGLAGMAVRIVGQPSKSVQTKAGGTFAIDGVSTFGNYPVYIEADGKKEFRHRYRLGLNSLKNAELFLFRKNKVMAWLGQIEGGISSESGMIVAATPTVVAANEKIELLPTVSSLWDGATLAPEAYTLSAEDVMQAKTPLTTVSPRFLSIQVPEGLNVAKLQDQAKHTFWSELVISSPGVINVLGPW